MSSSSKRKRVVLSIDQKLAILIRLEKGELASKLSKEFNIGVQTVRDLKKRKTQLNEYAEISEKLGIVKRRKTLRKPLFEKVDNALYAWLKEKKSNDDHISGNHVIEMAKYFHESLGLQEKFNASTGWLTRFKERHGIGSGFNISPVKIRRKKLKREAKNEIESEEEQEEEEDKNVKDEAEEQIDYNETVIETTEEFVPKKIDYNSTEEENEPKQVEVKVKRSKRRKSDSGKRKSKLKNMKTQTPTKKSKKYKTEEHIIPSLSPVEETYVSTVHCEQPTHFETPPSVYKYEQTTTSNHVENTTEVITHGLALSCLETLIEYFEQQDKSIDDILALQRHRLEIKRHFKLSSN